MLRGPPIMDKGVDGVAQPQFHPGRFTSVLLPDMAQDSGAIEALLTLRVVGQQAR